MEVLVVIGIFLVMITILMPVVQMTRERAHKINCANNLMRMSLGLHSYAQDHNDAFPPSLGALYPNYVEDSKTFDCPGSKRIGTPDKPDYDYGAGLTESSPQASVIAYDLDDNHRGRTRNILRIDGSVEWVGK